MAGRPHWAIQAKVRPAGIYDFCCSLRNDRLVSIDNSVPD